MTTITENQKAELITDIQTLISVHGLCTNNSHIPDRFYDDLITLLTDYAEELTTPVEVDPVHPLIPVFTAALNQCRHGKGVRHGGDTLPFYDQQWADIAKNHGLGFLTGQAVKKLNESRTKGVKESSIRELLGALVYTGAAILALLDFPTNAATHFTDDGEYNPNA
jgi:hypothetical protein